MKRSLLALIFSLACLAPAQDVKTGNASSLQGKRIKAPLTCSDGFVITWVAANTRFECLASSGGGGGGGGSVAASSVTAGTFGAGSYGFPANLTLGTLGSTEPTIYLGNLGTAPWVIQTSSSTFNGTRDDVFHFGYNCDAAVSAKHGWCVQFESDYEPTEGANHLSEFFLLYNTPTPFSQKRPLFFSIDQTTYGVYGEVAGEFVLRDSNRSATGGFAFRDAAHGTGNLEILSPALITSMNNNTEWLAQKDSAGTLRHLARLDGTNVWRMGTANKVDFGTGISVTGNAAVGTSVYVGNAKAAGQLSVGLNAAPVSSVIMAESSAASFQPVLSLLTNSSIAVMGDSVATSNYTLDRTYINDFSQIGVVGIGHMSGAGNGNAIGVLGIGNGGWQYGIGGRFVGTSFDAIPSYGVKAQAVSFTGGTGYGVYVDTGSGTGTNWALYTNGTTPSFFGGHITLNTDKATTGTRYLCVDTNGLVTASATACSGT